MLKNILQKLRVQKTLILSNVAEGTHDKGALTLNAAAAISSKYLFGKTTTNPREVALAGSGNTSSGARAVLVISDEAEATGDSVAAHVIGCTGSTMKVLAGGSIAIGDLITSNSSSQAVALSAQSAGTYYIYGIALTAAASGELVEFAPTPGLTQVKS